MTTRVNKDEDPMGVARAVGLPTADDVEVVCPDCGSRNVNDFGHLDDGTPVTWECYDCGNTFEPEGK